ncbi:MAG: STAS domain-containing protein [Fibrobacter sp.]|nr:STAS domain-containing protein [Fibrobacter sp.]
MESTINKTREWFIIAVNGQFVVKNLMNIRAAFDKAEQQRENRVAVDLNNTTHVDSSAITLLANFQKRLLARGAKVIIFGVNKDIAEIFSIVGLDKIISILSNDQFQNMIEKKIDN